MHGSFVKNESDVFSDIEFYVFLNPGVKFDRRDWVNQIDEVSVFFVNEFGSEVAVFKALIRGEFHFLPVGKIEVIKSWAGLISFEYYERMKLVGKDGKLSNILDMITRIGRIGIHRNLSIGFLILF